MSNGDVNRMVKGYINYNRTGMQPVKARWGKLSIVIKKSSTNSTITVRKTIQKFVSTF